MSIAWENCQDKFYCSCAEAEAPAQPQDHSFPREEKGADATWTPVELLLRVLLGHHPQGRSMAFRGRSERV